jgi:hypothetical protein
MNGRLYLDGIPSTAYVVELRSGIIIPDYDTLSRSSTKKTGQIIRSGRVDNVDMQRFWECPKPSI